MKVSRGFIFAVLFLVLGAAQPSAQEWNIQVVDDAGSAGYCSKITATSDGIPYILYQANGSLITLTWWVSGGGPGGWERITWGDYDGYHIVMDVEADPYDDVHVAYTNMVSPYRIKYGVFDHATKSWSLSPEVAVTSYGDLSLAVRDSSGAIIPAIAYSQRGAPNALKITIRDPNSGVWNNDTIFDDYETDRPSIAVDSAGKLHVSFYETTGQNLMYATNTSGFWICEYVDISGDVGSQSAIAIDAGDVPYIVYYDATNTDLKYAKVTN